MRQETDSQKSIEAIAALAAFGCVAFFTIPFLLIALVLLMKQ